MAQLPDAVPDLTQMVRSRGLLGSASLITTENERSECQLLSLTILKIILAVPPLSMSTDDSDAGVAAAAGALAAVARVRRQGANHRRRSAATRAAVGI